MIIVINYCTDGLKDSCRHKKIIRSTLAILWADVGQDIAFSGTATHLSIILT